MVSTFVLVVTAVALFAVLDDLVAAEGARAGGEAVPLAAVAHRVQHRADVAHRARGELAVVRPVAGRRRREHYKVALLPARPALRRVVVRRAEVMSDFVRQRELADFGRHSAVVVDECDDAGVERPLRTLVHAADCLRVSLVLLTDAARGTARARYPRQS